MSKTRNPYKGLTLLVLLGLQVIFIGSKIAPSKLPMRQFSSFCFQRTSLDQKISISAESAFSWTFFLPRRLQFFFVFFCQIQIYVLSLEFEVFPWAISILKWGKILVIVLGFNYHSHPLWQVWRNLPSEKKSKL